MIYLGGIDALCDVSRKTRTIIRERRIIQSGGVVQSLRAYFRLFILRQANELRPCVSRHFPRGREPEHESLDAWRRLGLVGGCSMYASLRILIQLPARAPKL